MHRLVAEFSTLSTTGASGFTLQGSGSATVLTPSNYTDGRTYLVKIHSRTGSTTDRLRPRHGRLQVGVALGPPDSEQEYSEGGPPAPSATTVYSTAVTITEARTYVCARPPGGIVGSSLGPVRLGMTRSQARRQFARVSTRGRRYMDFFCTGDGGIRVGYPSPQLLRSVSAAQQRRLRGRVVLILTSSRYYALAGARPGTQLATLARRRHVSRPSPVGLNTWYLVPDGSVRGVVKVRNGLIEEIGIADAISGASQHEANKFFRSFT
jgi:hypothetical protein